jgi:nitrogen fixation NifU-like protein
MTTPSDDDLYQTLVLDHARNPRNREGGEGGEGGAGTGDLDAAALRGATHVARGDNPFCGDRLTLSLVIARDRIIDVRWTGAGCAVATASASMMTVAIKGRSLAEARSLSRRFERLLGGAAGDAPADADTAASAEALGDLRALAGVRRFPVRVKCARLAWQTMAAALAGAGAGNTVSTE